ncbi:enoyl-CoA hydratase [Prosthecodimorpha staleyi]|uniref:Enoyl-CoA hydratase domain-containing protein 3, mitochondrial n=1 Tax=Prosthecodimorpha staleyi TaxID=2840188 RepID=A0A947D0J2_9HYPH|nr:enoyl-CoA hydratase [Prosthecodimorpha staleyi]MBT9288023.1 enoyl-CoA hydratase [Prosthecodimorpha staleyi]
MSISVSTAAASAAPAPAAAAILRERLDDGVLRLTLDHAERRNALSEAMMAALQEALDRAAADPAVRVVVIGHTGPAFSAGHDLKELTARRADADRGRAYFETVMKTCARLMTSVVRLPKPVIAEISGLATAAGCQLVASCDLAVAGEGARFATPGVHIGLFCSTPMVALSRNLAPKHAMEMLLTGETVDAATALRFGLVNRVVPPAELTAETGRLAATIAAKSPATLKIGKEAFYRQVEMDLDAAYAYAAGVMVDNMLIRDAEEGIGAFIEKRPPQWRGA